MNETRAFFLTTAMHALSLVSTATALAQSGPTPQPAQPQASLARRYSERSLSLLGSAGIGSFIALDNESTSTGLRAEAELRWVSRGWLIAPRLGLSGSFTTLPSTPTVNSAAGSIAVAPGVGFGVLRPLADNVALAVVASYRFEAGSPLVGQAKVLRLSHSGAIEAPLSIFITPRAFIEPTLSVSLTHTEEHIELGSTRVDLSRTYVSAGAVMRAGYCF